ncbi:hypothetical protein SAMN05216605_13315 [Pseudomonas abietaniphila]|uniref:Uncharacterized protein n=1 Tax=Pseudomonas abietaniphila TaxID=89065 RepID=A0A1G8U7Z9_9PSED|nr:hypothetical protein SAMN05216605_13315 [Pseudomonas abietaniphila]
MVMSVIVIVIVIACTVVMIMVSRLGAGRLRIMRTACM